MNETAAPTIFLSYRREDSAGHTGRLADALGARFGVAHVFRDIEGIEPGEDFVEAVRREIATCDVVLVVIGRDWLDVRDAAGRRRLDDPADHVRQEIAAALERDVRVIPVLVENAVMPRQAELPADIAPLARRNALPLSDVGWDDDVARLAAAIARTRAAPTPSVPTPVRQHARRGRRVRTAIGVAAAVGLVLVAALAVRGRPDAGDVAPSPAEPPAASASPLASRALRMSGPLDARLGLAVVSLRSLRVDSVPDGFRLVAGFRLENRATVALPFLHGEFELDQGDGRADALGETDAEVSPGDAADVEWTWALEPGAIAAVLRFRHAGEFVEVPIDLRPDQVATPEPPLPATALLNARGEASATVGPIEIAFEGADLRRFVNIDVVTARFRATNAGAALEQFSSQDLLLVVDGVVEPPYSSLALLLPAGATVADSAVYRIAPGAREISLRVRFGEEQRELPLTVPPAR